MRCRLPPSLLRLGRGCRSGTFGGGQLSREVLEVLWVGTRSQSSRLSSSDDNPFASARVQPVKFQSSSRWMTGYAERGTNLTSPSQKGTLQETGEQHVNRLLCVIRLLVCQGV